MLIKICDTCGAYLGVEFGRIQGVSHGKCQNCTDIQYKEIMNFFKGREI